MSNEPKEHLESIGQAARRLLQGMDERKKKAAGCPIDPVEIQVSPPWSPAEKEASEASVGFGVRISFGGQLPGTGSVRLEFGRDSISWETHAVVVRLCAHANWNGCDEVIGLDEDWWI